MYYYIYPITLICNKIEQALFDPTTELIHQMEEELVYANNEKLDTYSEGFRHMDKFVTLRNCVSSKYKLPHLNQDLFDKFNEYQKFVDEWNKKEFYIDQFLKKVLLKGLKVNEQLTDDQGTPIQKYRDLAEVLPGYLLDLTDLTHAESNLFKEDPTLHTEWEKIKALINEMLALRMVVSK